MAEDEKPQPQEPKMAPVEPAAAEQPKPKSQAPAPVKSGRLAAILIRGLIGLDYDMKKTLEFLRLHQKHVCSVYEDTPSIRGMLVRAKDFITFGDIDEKTLKEMATKRGEEYKGREKDRSGKISYSKFITVDGRKIKPFFRLHPPRGGFERKGIKQPFTTGGVLGNRKARINDLIIKML